MRCNYKKEDIEKYSEGTLSVNSAEKLKEHIKSCEACSSYYETLSFIDAVSKNNVELKKDLSDKIAEKIDKERYAKSKFGYDFTKILYVFGSLVKQFAAPALVVLIVLILASVLKNIPFSTSKTGSDNGTEKGLENDLEEAAIKDKDTQGDKKEKGAEDKGRSIDLYVTGLPKALVDKMSDEEIREYLKNPDEFKVPEDILSKMGTEVLVEAVFEYPKNRDQAYYGLLFPFKDASLRREIKFPVFESQWMEELLKREDAPEKIIEKYRTETEGEKYEKDRVLYTKLNSFSHIITDYRIIGLFSKEQLKELKRLTENGRNIFLGHRVPEFLGLIMGEYYLPEDEIENMSTDELVPNVLEYPLEYFESVLRDYDMESENELLTDEEAFEIIKILSNVYAELITREDVTDVLLDNYINFNKDTEDEYQNKKLDQLENLISSRLIIERFNEGQLRLLEKEIIESGRDGFRTDGKITTYSWFMDRIKHRLEKIGTD